MNIRYVLMTIAIAFLSTPSNAQNPIILEILDKWNNAAPAPNETEVKTEIRTKALEVYGSSEVCKKSAIAIDHLESAAADRFSTNSLIRGAIRNAWFVTARIPGCDSVPVRFMIIQNNDKSFKTIRVNRGVSNAWDSLIGDTLPLARLAAVAAVHRTGHKCEGVEQSTLGIMRIASEDANLGKSVSGVRYTGKWAEIWPIQVCGKTVEVYIEFTADGDGGAYSNTKGAQHRILP